MVEQAPPPAVTHLLESSLYVDDLERSAAFYEGLFGWSILGGDARFKAFAVGTQVLLLFRKGGTLEPVVLPTGSIPPHDGGGNLHLAFAIPKEELGRWEGRLEAYGIAIESRVTWPRGGVSLYFRDPDSHLVELATPGLWRNY